MAGAAQNLSSFPLKLQCSESIEARFAEAIFEKIADTVHLGDLPADLRDHLASYELTTAESCSGESAAVEQVHS